MKVELLLYTMIGLANASVLGQRRPDESSVESSGYPEHGNSPEPPKDGYKAEIPTYEPTEEEPPVYEPPKYEPTEEEPPVYEPPKYEPTEEEPPVDEYKPTPPVYEPTVEEPPKYEATEEAPPEHEYKPTPPVYEPPKYEPTEEAYPEEEAPEEEYPEEEAPEEAYPKEEYPKPDYPKGGYTTDEFGSDYPKDKSPKAWTPKTHNPEFFSLKVDDRCLPAPVAPAPPLTEEEAAAAAADCFFDGYAIRLEKGIVIATPYNKWWDPKLPIFFVDDDTQAYTVSKKPLQLYVDAITGALRYAPVGWLPANSVAISFYKLGNNPLGKVGPSPSYFAWPTTEGRANTELTGKTWWLCPISFTGQYQVFISDVNFGASGQGGIYKDQCQRKSLAAINANPWTST